MRSFLCMNSRLCPANIVLYLQTRKPSDMSPPVFLFREKRMLHFTWLLFIHWNFNFFQLFPEFSCCVMENLLMQLSLVQRQHSDQGYLLCALCISVFSGPLVKCSDSYKMKMDNHEQQWLTKEKIKSKRKLERNFLRPQFGCTHTMSAKWSWNKSENSMNFSWQTLLLTANTCMTHSTYSVAWPISSPFHDSAQPCLHIMTHPP